MFCLPLPIHSYICERFIYFQDSLPILLHENMWTNPGNYKSLTDTSIWKLVLVPEKEYINGICTAVYDSKKVFLVHESYFTQTFINYVFRVCSTQVVCSETWWEHVFCPIIYFWPDSRSCTVYS